jgi:dihydroorotate dehydrogenase
LLFLLPAELAHHVAFTCLRVLMALPLLGGWLRRALSPRDKRLSVTALGKQFPSPIGLAAGFDKDARGYDALGALGFGFVEVGTVTAEPQPGNPKPRLFRLPEDRALINRMGFNNLGAKAMQSRLLGPRKTVLGVNIGKTKLVPEEGALADYEQSARSLAAHADYLVVNVSSPNTPGLRALQSVEKLRPLLQVVRAAADQARGSRVPLFVKIAPDLADEDVDQVAQLALELQLEGVIATNTTVERGGLKSDAVRVEACGNGGLSGAPLQARSLAVLQRLRQQAGERLILISVGGIETAEQVFERLAHGATLVQLYTAFIYQGPLLVKRLNDQLVRLLEREGFEGVAQLTASAYAGINPPKTPGQSAASTRPETAPVP